MKDVCSLNVPGIFQQFPFQNDREIFTARRVTTMKFILLDRDQHNWNRKEIKFKRK